MRSKPSRPPLFERRSQGVRLTALGSAVAGEFSAAFDRLGGAVQALRRRAVPSEIRIADLPLTRGMLAVQADVIFPVCAPEIAARLRRPSDLAGETLLHDAAWTEDWPRWAKAAELEPAFDLKGPVYSLHSLAVEMAKSGAGVLIGRAPLLRAELTAVTLVAPFDIRLTLPRRLALARAQPAEAGSPLAAVVEALRRI